MNLQQGKIILEKINRLYQSMTLDSKIDSFEQELMALNNKSLKQRFEWRKFDSNLLPELSFESDKIAFRQLLQKA